MDVLLGLISLFLLTETGLVSGTEVCHSATNRCYWVAAENNDTWDGARSICQSEGGDLAVMETQELWDFVLSQATNLGLGSDVHWIGLTDASLESIFRWINESPLNVSAWHFQGGAGEPNGRNGENCALLWDLLLVDAFCVYQSYPILCSSLAPNCTSVKDACVMEDTKAGRKVQVLTDLHNPATWDAARDKCAELGLELLTINSPEKNTQLQAVLQGTTPLQASLDIWLGANDREVETIFRWTDESIVNFMNWQDLYPTGSSSTSEDCLSRLGADGKWVDTDCSVNRNFYSETPKATCTHVALNNTALNDNRIETCVDVPQDDTGSLYKLFSAHVSSVCVENSHITVTLHYESTTSGVTCGDKIGWMTSDSTICNGRKVCKVLNPGAVVTSGCRFSCSCIEDSGCGISFYYGREIAEVQGFKICEMFID